MGPLQGIRVIELQGIGPGPFCGMMLSDMGAEVIRIDRAGNVSGIDSDNPPIDVLARGRSSIGVDLKNPEGVEVVLRLIETADALIEGFRPGVMERLGLGPEECLARNPRLVFGRMTGWVQEGPYAMAAGHDINYIALTGALYAIVGKDKPVPPLNLVGDFGGGALYMAMGALAAYIEAQKSGEGQVVDCSMVEGAASLMTAVYGMLADGRYVEEREANRLDGGCHHYNVYETSDGEHICIGSNEPQFYAEMLKTVGLEQANLPEQTDRNYWPEMTERLAAIFKTKTREEWTELMEQKEICYAPVLRPSEAIKHHHNVARNTFIEVDGYPQPGPAPKFSRTESKTEMGSAFAGQLTEEALADWGFAADEVSALTASGAAKQR